MTYLSCRLRHWLLIASWISAGWPALSTAGELLKLVGQDAAAYAHFDNLAEQVQRLDSSEFVRRVRSSPFFATWQASREYQKLVEAQTSIESLTGQPLKETLKGLLGKEVVIAVYAAPGSAPRGIVLLDAEHRDAIDGVLRLWNQLDQLQVKKHRHREIEYASAASRSGEQKPVVFYSVIGTVLAFSDDESLIRRTLDLSLSEDASESLLKKTEPQATLQRASQSDVCSISINPRAWDSTVLSSPSRLPAALEVSWKHCRWLTARIALQDDEITVSLEVDYDRRGVPDWWNECVSSDEASRASLDSIPPDAILAATGRLHGEALSGFIGAASGARPLPPDADRLRRIVRGLLMGLDPLDDILPRLGPHWTMVLVPRDTTATNRFPVDGLIAIELSPPGPNDKSVVPRALDNAFSAALNMLAAMQNAKGGQDLAVVQQRPASSATLRWVEPIGMFRPSALVSDQQLVIATVPELCERFVSQRTAESVAAETLTVRQIDRLENADQVLFANSRAARRVLREHRDWFLKQAAKDRVTTEEAERRLKDFEELLELVDAAYFSFGADQQLIRVTVGAIATP